MGSTATPTRIAAAPSGAIPDSHHSDRPGPLVVTLGLVSLVALTAAWSTTFEEVHLGAPPFMGSWELHLGIRAIAPLVVAGAVIVGAGRLTALPWRRLLLVATALSAAWATSLAMVDGLDRLTDPLVTRWEHLVAVPLVGDPLRFLDRFVTDLPSFPTHVRSHPPGTVLTFWSLDRVGLGGAGWAAAVVIGAGSAATAAVLVTFREVAGEDRARRAAPFLVISPFAIWIATSADALYLGVGATAVALLVCATGRSGRRSLILAATGGLVAAGALFLSYGLVLLGIIPVAVAAARRRLDVAAVAAVPLALVALVLAGAGFWWWDGLTATRHEYWGGVASERPFAYFVVANLVVAAVAAGPAVWGGLARRPRGGAALLVGAGLAAVMIADLSGLSKGEVERIWLPFLPFLAVATAGLPPSRRRGWLAATAGTAILLQLALRSPW